MVRVIKPVLIDVSLSLKYPKLVLTYSNRSFVLSRIGNVKQDFFDYAPSIKHRLNYIDDILGMHSEAYFFKNVTFIEPQEVFNRLAVVVNPVKA